MRHAPVFADWYGLSPIPGRICAALYEADTRALTVADLRARVGHNPASIRSGLVALRIAMDPGELISDGVRYALTEAGMDDCNTALADARLRGVAA